MRVMKKSKVSTPQEIQKAKVKSKGTKPSGKASQGSKGEVLSKGLPKTKVINSQNPSTAAENPSSAKEEGESVEFIKSKLNKNWDEVEYWENIDIYFKKHLDKFESLQPFFSDRETLRVMNQYASKILTYYQKMDEYRNISPEFLNRHGVDHLLRLKMINWFVEIFYSFKYMDRSFFLAVDYMDRYFSNTTRIIQINDFLKVAVTCVFIACKVQEVYPLCLRNVERQLAHDKIKAPEIINQEIDILNTIESDLEIVTTYDFISILFTDLLLTRKKSVEKYELKEHILKGKKAAIYFAKLMCHFGCFSHVSAHMKAILCISNGFDIYEAQHKELNYEQLLFINSWIEFLRRSSNFDEETVNTVSQDLETCFYNFQKSADNNLNKTDADFL